MNVLYSANPPMFRNKPLGFSLAAALIVLGIGAPIAIRLYPDSLPIIGSGLLASAVSVLSLAAAGISFLALMVWFVRTKALKLSVTESEILFERGLLSKTRSETHIERVRAITVRQTFFDRIFGVGAIEIYTSGDQPEITAEGMPNPNRVREIIKDIQGNQGEPGTGEA